MAKRIAILLFVLLSAKVLCAVNPPLAILSNGELRVRLYLPDPQRGFYRATRFDWSGFIAGLVYQHHHFYAPWFSRIDPQVHDFVFEGPDIVASPCSAAFGPVDEFEPLGWNEAKPGGTFIKIGVGALRKEGAPYDRFKLYPIVNGGDWKTVRSRDSVEFLQDVSDPSSGYGYEYRKTVRLVAGTAEMILAEDLKNTGWKTIDTSVYYHNFLYLDRQAPGPGFTITFPFPIRSSHPPDAHFARLRGDRIVYLKPLQGKNRVAFPISGFRRSAKDYRIRIENWKLGVGMTIAGDQPLSKLFFWSIRTALSVEPYIAIRVPPGGDFHWQVAYTFYSLPAADGPR